MKPYPVVILCGGKGTRLREQTEFMPKPLVNIGGRPILWHIMKIYAHYGYKSFLCCLGYKGEMIKQYFLNYEYMSNDFMVTIGHKNNKIIMNQEDKEWSITLADTGLETMTGGRIKRIEKYITSDHFMVTYGDGVANIDIDELMKFHLAKGKIATVTGIHPISRFGIIERNRDGMVERFREKPQVDEIINGGFFVFSKRVFDYLDLHCVLERGPMEQLAQNKELAVYEHKGFWFSVDTYRDYLEINKMWDENDVPWKIWED